MTKFFMALIATESNTYSPILTGEESFRETGLYFGDATRHPPKMFNVVLANWRQRGEAMGMEIVESISAFAMPGGPVVHRYYLTLRDRLLADLEAAIPVDMVLLCLHGAMVSTQCLDCEGDILRHVRDLVGPDTPIGVELDLHCSITRDMMANADIMVTFKQYPHVDMVARAEEVFDLTLATAAGSIHPTMALQDCRMIHRWPTSVDPMRGFVQRLSDLEGRDKVLSVSLAHGFAFGDVPDAGAHVLVVTDGDQSKAADLALSLSQEFWRLRHEASINLLDDMQALDLALACEGNGPAVVADTSDNAGSGGSSDSTFLLREVLDRGIENVALGYYWDPIAIRFACEAGVGEKITLRIGGKVGPQSGAPVDLDVEVCQILPQHSQSMGGIPADMGVSVWLRHGTVDLVLTALRTQVLSPDGFEGLGIDLAAKDLVIVKSNQHFYDDFEPLARAIFYACPPGPTRGDFSKPRFHRRKAPYWPLAENPFAEDPTAR